jgi:hypothetical protein
VAFLKGTDPTHNKVLQETVIAGRAMGIQVDAVEATSPEQTERAFVDFHRRDIQGVIAAPDALFFRDRERIAQLAVEQPLPLMFWSRETVISGGLLS